MKSSVSNKRVAFAVLLFLPALMLLALPFYSPGDVPVLLLMIGRFHPVILHFPIVLIIVALILEILRRLKMLIKADLVVTIILVTAAISSIIAIASGYLLYASGDYSGILLERHLLLGAITGASILIAIAFFFIWRATGKLYTAYFVTLLFSNGAVAYTSHLGGALTHGEDYLTEYIPLLTAKPEEQKPKRSDAEMLVYDDMIMPVFEAKCISCHNESRTKGELSMTSLEKIIKGGESENPGIVPGIADSSELYKRIVLPKGHEDRMPPEGKTPMTPDETALFRFWIQGGGDAQLRVADAVKDTNMAVAVNNVLPQLERYRRKQRVAEIKNQQLKKELDTIAWQMNIVISADSTSDEDLFTIAVKFPPAPFNTEQMRELAPYRNVFSKLSLVSSGIEDEALYHISKMENLNALYLQKTNLNGTGLVHLKNMEKLEVLNLSYTKVTDRSLFELLNIPNLREVYLFQTSASPDVIKALQSYKPSVKFLMEEGPYL